jgi:hypothetical protein
MNFFDLAKVRRMYPDWRITENGDGTFTAVRIGDQHTVTAMTTIGLMTKMDVA